MFLLPTPHAHSQKADQEGPLGLTWGFTADEVRALGVELKSSSGGELGVTFEAAKLPRALSDQEVALLAFGYDDKLWRVMVISKSFTNDPTGASLRARYEELSTVLAEKYGKPSSVQNLGNGNLFYQKPENFIYGLSKGEIKWFSNYQTPNLFVQLALAADTMHSGRWRIIVQNKSLQKGFDAAKKAKEKGSL
jgi:hypothetical protein